MSKRWLLFSLAVIVPFLPPFSAGIFARQSTATLNVTPGLAPTVSVTIDLPKRRQLSFLKTVAGANDLTKRISNLRLAESASGPDVKFRELQPGEYLAERDFSLATYDISLSPLKDRSAAAHASWLKGDVGILMLGDILPETSNKDVEVSFAGATPVASIDLKANARKASVRDAANSIFYIGSGWRMRKTMKCWECATLFISGEWHFTDDELAKFVVDIEEHYDKQFNGQRVPGLVGIAIARFPVPTEPGAWEAETRGQNVTIISSDMPFKTQSVQRLHEQLRHEMFHLWIPNRLGLTGNYDWFYEGFALYQSLKLAVAQNRIRFEDFLDTLSRAHTIDSAYTQRPSLIDASRNRFGGTNTQVYARGMLVAFLTDLTLMENSKSSVEDLLRTLYRTHQKPTPAEDGNDAVIKLLKTKPGVERIVDKYVTGKETLEWKEQLRAAGIEDSDPGPITTLRVIEKPSGKQKTMLDKLGYNNWRKLSPNSK
jgi:hypothetical protein